LAVALALFLPGARTYNLAQDLTLALPAAQPGTWPQLAAVQPALSQPEVSPSSPKIRSAYTLDTELAQNRVTMVPSALTGQSKSQPLRFVRERE
jgi:hypothetical protein